jgi:hypothetical protein
VTIVPERSTTSRVPSGDQLGEVSSTPSVRVI